MQKRLLAGKNKKFWHMGRAAVLTVLFVFSAIYLLSMLLATYLVQSEFAGDYQEARLKVLEQFQPDAVIAYSLELGALYEENISNERVSDKDLLRGLLERCAMADDDGYQIMSAAIYDSYGRLIVQTVPELVTVTDEGRKYSNLSEYLTEEDIDRLAMYKAERDDCIINGGTERQNYEFSITLADDKKTPAEIIVFAQEWQQYETQEAAIKDLKDTGIGMQTNVTSTGEIFGLKKEARVWHWENPYISEKSKDATTYGASYLNFQVISAGYGVWEKWREDPYFYEFPEELGATGSNTDVSGLETSSGGCRREMKSDIYLPMSGDEEGGYTLVLRSESHPWTAALNDLKYVYPCGFLFVAGCGIFTLWVLEKTYRQKERMEEQRRDFINVMAHEIKSPLGVIRGFSENLKEHPDAEKRGYYLEQMIRQTEEVDSLVKEMIAVTRMDWEQLKIKKAPVSVWDVLNRETERLAVQAEEKRLQVISKLEEDWILQGDMRLLEEAFYNLLSNAVSYNREEGRVRIFLNSGNCVIENTGANIPPEHLPHVCEMFYTVQQGAGGREKHLGMGLYLSRQIFIQHGLSLSVENTEEGVRVTVKK